MLHVLLSLFVSASSCWMVSSVRSEIAVAFCSLLCFSCLEQCLAPWSCSVVLSGGSAQCSAVPVDGGASLLFSRQTHPTSLWVACWSCVLPHSAQSSLLTALLSLAALPHQQKPPHLRRGPFGLSSACLTLCRRLSFAVFCIRVRVWSPVLPHTCGAVRLT